MSVQPEDRPTSVPSRGTGGLSFNQYQNPMNSMQEKVVIRGMNQASNSNAIYLKEAKHAYLGTQRDEKTGVLQDIFMEIPGADISYYFLSNEAKKALADQMDGLYGKGVWQPSWIAKAYSRGLQASAYAYANMGKRVTAVEATAQLLAQDAANGLKPDGTSAGNGVGGPRTTVAQTRSVNLTDPMSARKLVDDSLSTYLGRRATTEEQQAFMKALNRAEERAPSITTQVSRTTPGKGMTAVESETRTEGGFNPSVFAEEFARGQEGAAEYQAATTYLDSFIGSLKARV